MNRVNLGSLAAILGLLAPWAPALAQVNLAAQAGNLQYTVTDLAPGDGVAPAIDFAGAPVVDLSATARAYAGSRVIASGSEGRPVQGPGAIVLDPWAGAHLGAGSFGNGAVVAASFAPIQGIVIDNFERATLEPWDFRLAPHTRVTFSMDMTAELSSTGGIDAEAQVALDATFNPTGETFPLTDGLIAMIGAVRMHEYVPNDTEARTATVEWDNNSDAWVNGQLDYSVRLDGTLGSASPVPEPSEWAMLGLGCGLLGLWRRRRVFSRLAPRSPGRCPDPSPGSRR